MTDREEQELREWAAEVMGQTLYAYSQFGKKYVCEGGKLSGPFTFNDWMPDKNLNQAFQFMSFLEEKYKENLSWIIDADNDNVLDGHLRIRVEVAVIIDGEVTGGEEYVATTKEIATALMRAAKATGIKGEDQ